MSHIVTKMIKGNPYLYQVRSERRGNRVVQVFEKYLGRADKVNPKTIDAEVKTNEPLPLTTKPAKSKQTRTRVELAQVDDNWLMLRSLVYSRDNGMCWICHRFVQLHDYDLGHLVDRCNGGNDDYDNLVVMHKRCNQAKPQHHAMEEHITWLLKTRFIKTKNSMLGMKA